MFQYKTIECFKLKHSLHLPHDSQHTLQAQLKTVQAGQKNSFNQ